MVTTLDVLSHGRAYLGIGAGWYERETTGLGLPFPSTKVRFEWLEETLQIAHKLWDDDDHGAFAGTHFQLAEAVNHPQPISSPHPPIMVGGMGEKKTLRLVAQYADACNLFAGPSNLATIEHKLNVLKRHADAVGRSYDELEKTTVSSAFWGGLGTPQQIIDYLKRQADLGVDHAIFTLPNLPDLAQIDAFAETIIPALADR